LHKETAIHREELADLLDILDAKSADLQPSLVYNGKESVISPSRSSRECELVESTLFQLGIEILRRLCPEVFQLLRLVQGHIDFVESGVGDYCNVHTDFPLLSIAGEGEVAHTLLLCVEAADEGGDLLLYAGSPQETVVRYTTGSATLFPCALPHAGKLVKQGKKKLLKYDVMSTEPLWKFEIRNQETATYDEQMLKLGTLARLDYFVAKAIFEGESGYTQTCLVSVDELKLLAEFFNGTARGGDTPQIQILLDRLCCCEAKLTSSELRKLITQATTLLPSYDVARLFIPISSMYAVLFVACAHRRKGIQSDEAADEIFQSYCSSTPGGMMLFCSSSSADMFRCCAFHRSAAATKRIVFNHAIKSIELHDENLVSSRSPTQRAAEDIEYSADGEAESSEGGGEWVATMPSMDISANEMRTLSIRATEAIREAHPTRRLVSAHSEVNECNDGSTYQEVWYQTTILRSGYVLLKRN